MLIPEWSSGRIFLQKWTFLLQKTENLAPKPTQKSTTCSKDDPRRPRALHKTSSIFLRNLAPTITKVEVEALCRRYEGFLRSAIADPAPDRRWFRRGWVTFKRDVKIKDICFNLNNTRLRDCELGPIVNRDLTRRYRVHTMDITVQGYVSCLSNCS